MRMFVCLGAKNGAKAILCEKPMAVSLAECDRMIEACATAGHAARRQSSDALHGAVHEGQGDRRRRVVRRARERHRGCRQFRHRDERLALFRDVPLSRPTRCRRRSRPGSPPIRVANPRGAAVRGSCRQRAHHHGKGAPLLYGCRHRPGPRHARHLRRSVRAARYR